MQNDSIEGIYDTLKECAAISKSAGGIGLHIHNIRAVGSYIRGTNGTSNGIVPMLRVFNDTARSASWICFAQHFQGECIWSWDEWNGETVRTLLLLVQTTVKLLCMCL